jgi:hypothetical protein
VTTPESPDTRNAGATAAGQTAPPWQRVGKDGASEDVPYSNHDQTGSSVTDREHHPGTGDYPVVGGAATRRLFGDTGEQPAVRDQSPGRDRPEGPTRSRPMPSALRRPGRGPRRASLQIKRFDPWSVLKLSLVLGVAMFFVWMVAVGVLYTVLDGMGVWDKLNGTVSQLISGEGTTTSTTPLISAGRVFGVAAILGAINIVLVSALATVSAFIYNVSADLAGGLEVTLSERE